MSDGATEDAPGDRGARVVVVLVQPLHPGNVGAAARAMRNFGLEELVLVDPPAYDPERARWMAPGCADLLARARIVGSVREALVGVHRVFATTARHRRLGQVVLEPADVAARVAGDDRSAAFLFGREDFGLSNDDVARCEALVRIATPEHASLNLAQSVLLVAHHLFEARRKVGDVRAPGRTLAGGRRRGKATADARRTDPRDGIADAARLEPAADAILEVLGRVGYLRGTSPDKVRATTSQALQQAGLSIRHLEALRGMINRVAYALDHGVPDAAPEDGEG